jgi:hypothetical protein
VGLSTGQLCSIPRRLVDARRHTGKPTDADKEEGLLPYDPVLPVTPQWILSYSKTASITNIRSTIYSHYL